MKFNLPTFFFLTILFSSCTNKNELINGNYILEIQRNCIDTLAMHDNKKGTYYHCGIGVKFSSKYKVTKNELIVQILDDEFQYKPSDKIIIAEFKYEIINDFLKLNSISYPNENYNGAFRYLNSKISTEKYKRVN